VSAISWRYANPSLRRQRALGPAVRWKRELDEHAHLALACARSWTLVGTTRLLSSRGAGGRWSLRQRSSRKRDAGNKQLVATSLKSRIRAPSENSRRTVGRGMALIVRNDHANHKALRDRLRGVADDGLAAR